MPELFSEIAIDAIEDTQRYTLHPFLKDTPPVEELAESIKRSTLLHPPAVIQGPSGGYNVIYGRERLKCMKLLGKNTVTCRVLPQRSTHLELLTILLEDQYCQGELTVIEQACFIGICNSLLPDKNTRLSFLKSLPSTRIPCGLHFLSPLLSLNPELQKKIHRSIISEKIIADLRTFDDQDQMLLTLFIEQLPMSAGNQKKLTQLLREIVRREEVSLSSLLDAPLIQAILLNPGMNSPQKVNHLFDHLQRRCYPLLSAATEDFQQEVDRLQLPEQCKVTASPSFEKDEVTLTIRFPTVTDLKTAWHEIGRFVA